jgi:hypothetical protein
MAGTVEVSTRRVGQSDKSSGGRCLIVAWTSDAAGAVTATINIAGLIHKVVTNPGATAPSANYDITLVDEDGIDIAQGLLANRHTTNSEEVYLYKEATLTGSVPAAIPIFHAGALTLTIAAAGDSKQGVVRIYYR